MSCSDKNWTTRPINNYSLEQFKFEQDTAVADDSGADLNSYTTGLSHKSLVSDLRFVRVSCIPLL